MTSLLIITSVESLQKKINETVKSFGNMIGIYVSLNKNHKSVGALLKKEKVNAKNIFFIDCVTSEKERDDVINVQPSQLDKLAYAIKSFINEVKGKKFLVIDALSTFLIYNDENKVAAFIKQTIEYASQNDVEVVAFSPKTKGEELLNKIFNFFDKVRKE